MSDIAWAKRDQRFEMMLATTDREMLETVAQRHDRKMADVIRQLVRAEYQRLQTPEVQPQTH